MSTYHFAPSSKNSHYNDAFRRVRIAVYIFFIFATIVMAGIIVFVIHLHRESIKVDQHGQTIELLTNATGPQRIFIDENDVYLMVIGATQKEFDSYLDNMSHYLTVFSILITIMVTLVGFVFPLYINREQGKANKEKIDEAVINGEAELNKRIKEIKGVIIKLIAINKKDIKTSNDRIERLTLEQIKIIDSRLNDLNTRLDNYSETIRIEELDRETDKIMAYKKQEKEGRATSDTYLNIARFYYVNKNLDMANKYLAMAVEHRENYAVVYPMWADILETQQQLYEAWEKREKAIMLNVDKQEQDKLNKQQETLLVRILNQGTTHREKLPIEVGGVIFNMILVHKGIFMMGATEEQGNSDPWANESPAHKVMLNDYYISETVVTQSLWKAVMKSKDKAYRTSGEKDDFPMCNVSWNDCIAFIKKLNEMTHNTFLLPTEAQWEFAARGGVKSKNYKYSGTNDINDAVWYWKNSGDCMLNGLYETDILQKNNCRTHSVLDKSMNGNELGIYGMSGNVWEWCRDKYSNYSSDPQVNPSFDDVKEECVVIRGGGCLSHARNCRVSSRYYYDPDEKDRDLGFRLVIEIEK